MGYWCVVGQGGEIIERVDLPSAIAAKMPELPPSEEAAATLTGMIRWAEETLKAKAPQFLADPDAPIRDRPLDAKGIAEIEAHLARQRRQAAERLK